MRAEVSEGACREATHAVAVWVKELGAWCCKDCGRPLAEGSP